MFGKKKEIKEKALPENATTFQKLWHNKRTHSAMVLGMYMLFIMVLIIIINIAPKSIPNVDEEKEEEFSYEKMQKNLEQSSFTFEYDITIQNHKINYNNEELEYEKVLSSYQVNYKGEKTKEEINGYKETNNEIIKFRESDGLAYNVLGEEPTQIEDLYENININYLDLYYIFTMIKPREFTKEIVTQTNKYIYETINLDDGRILDIIIYTNDKNITKIEINELKFTNDQEAQKSTYILNYSNIEN